MVIDFHTHIFPDKIAEKAIGGLVKASGGIYPPVHNGTRDGLLKNMDEYGVDISVLQPVVTKQSQTESLNNWVNNIQSDRLIAFGGIYPNTSTYKQDIDFVCSLGLKGIKLHPEYQSFVANAPEMLPIYDYALSRGLIILFHAGFDPAFPPPVRSNPKMFAQIAREMQGGIIIAAHLGGQKQWDEVEKYLCGTDIYLDTSMGFSYYGEQQFLRILKAHGADKILFGSDSPWSNAGEEIKIFNSLNIPQSDKDLILSKNAIRLLGL